MTEKPCPYTGKRSFKKRAQATRAFKNLGGDRVYRVYRCAYCGRFEATSQSTQQTARIKQASKARNGVSRS